MVSAKQLFKQFHHQRHAKQTIEQEWKTEAGKGGKKRKQVKYVFSNCLESQISTFMQINAQC